MKFIDQIYFLFFFFNDTATTEIYTLSLHDALPIYSPFRNLSASFGWETGCGFGPRPHAHAGLPRTAPSCRRTVGKLLASVGRSEEHTSELQSRQYLVCRLLLEKKK